MRNKRASLLTTAFGIAGAMLLALAYLMIWQPIFVLQAIKYAVVIGLAYFGGALLYAFFGTLTNPRKKG